MWPFNNVIEVLKCKVITWICLTVSHNFKYQVLTPTSELDSLSRIYLKLMKNTLFQVYSLVASKAMNCLAWAPLTMNRCRCTGAEFTCPAVGLYEEVGLLNDLIY